MRVHGGCAVRRLLVSLAMLLSTLAALTVRPGAAGEAGAATQPQSAWPGPGAVGKSDWHIIRRFDFDEAKLGNEGDVPMYWYRFKGPDYSDFPRFAAGYWDRTFGFNSKESFRLELNGGNVGYFYQTNTVAIQPGQDVRVEAKVRTAQLVHARALLEVSFNDARGEVIPASRRRSPLIGGPGQNDRWSAVAIMIPGRFPSARYINLSVFLLQPSRWRPLDPVLRDQPSLVDFIDVHGKAWFDDVVIYRLPRVTMTTGRPGQLVPPATQPAIRIDVEGFASQPLEAVLTVHDLAERLVGYQVFDSPGSDNIKSVRSLEWRGQPLSAGLYRSDLTLYAGGARMAGLPPLLSRQLTFAQLGGGPAGTSGPGNRGSVGSVGSRANHGQGFGLVLGNPPGGLDEASARALADEQAGAIAALPVNLVKLPLWRSDMRPDSLESADPWTEQVIRQLARQRIGVIGVFGSIPGPLTVVTQTTDPAAARGAAGNLRRSLLDVLAGDVAGWRPYVAPQLARYADQVRYWQIGREDEPGFAVDGRFSPAITGVRKEFHTLLSAPKFVVTWPGAYSYKRGLPSGEKSPRDELAPGEHTGGLPGPGEHTGGLPGPGEHTGGLPAADRRPRFPAEIANLFLASRVPPDSMLEYLNDFADLTESRPWATVEPPAPAAGDETPAKREGRLADLAWRLVMASAGLAQPVPPATVKGPKTAGTLFLAAPWTVRDVAGSQLIEPEEELLVFRTVGELLAGARYGGRIMLADGVVGHIFDRGDGTGAMAVLNTTGHPAVPIEMHFGENVARVDLWGNREPLASTAAGGADGTVSVQSVTAGRRPFFLDGIDPRLARLRASFRLDPPFVPSSYRKHVRTVQFINPFDTPISGRVTLHFPDNWEVHPRIIPFAVQAGETFTREIEIRFPYNAEAGTKTLAADFQIDADRAYRVQMATHFEFGLGDVDVNTMTQWLPDDELLVTMNVTNRSDGRLDMFCFVVAPDQAALPRQERVIAGLPPGGTAIKSFRIPQAKALVGKSIRVGLREVKGSRLVNYDVPIR